MKISYNWLREYVRGAAMDRLSVPQVADILTDTGLEVDSVERIESVRGGLAGVVVGRVVTCADHPDSDHLHVTTVDVGAAEPIQIVCGAPNVAAGQHVLVATVGAELWPTGASEGFKIKKSKIRGVESLGMICAEDELGIGAGHDGIMVLAGDALPGTPAAQHLDLQGDWTIEIGLTPNRVDGGSHFGVARDLTSYLRAREEEAELVRPSVENFEVDDRSLEIPVSVESKVTRYSGLTISGLACAPSPEWLQNRLRAIGLNPHNNLVDITNFVLHEMGQPLHAFDAAKIAGNQVVVRTCAEGTEFVTLDGVTRKLSADDLCICDAEKPMCIAGVMGGAVSGVTEATTEIFLESACFDPVSVRKTARRHGINSDSSFLFERGVDPWGCVYALKRAALMFKELAGGRISSDIVDVYPEEVPPFRFEFSLSRANRLIGKELPRETVLQILSALGVEVEGFDHVGGDVLRVAVPPYRVDVQREADLVEEILRIYGYNNVEEPGQLRSSLNVAPRVSRDSMQNIASELLTSNGLTEIMSNSLTRATYYDGLTSYPPQRCVRILNPLSNDLNAMRQTLIFNALEAIQLNTSHRNPDLKLYEFGNCYSFDNEAIEPQENKLAPYKEVHRLGIAVTGFDVQQSWNEPAAKCNFFTLSAIAQKLVSRFGFDLAAMQCEELESDLFAEAVSYRLNGKELAQIGLVSPKILTALDIKAPVWFAEMDFGHFVRSAATIKVRAQELARFPAVRRDLALVVDNSVTYSKLRSIALATEKKLLKNVTLFDVYEGDKIAAGKKSYALSFTLQDSAATLTDAAIERTIGNLLAQFERQAGAVLR